MAVRQNAVSVLNAGYSTVQKVDYIRRAAITPLTDIIYLESEFVLPDTVLSVFVCKVRMYQEEMLPRKRVPEEIVPEKLDP